jgi:hypothetical protein
MAEHRKEIAKGLLPSAVVIFPPTEYNFNGFQIAIAFLCVSYNSLEMAMKTYKNAGRLVAQIRHIIGKGT